MIELRGFTLAIAIVCASGVARADDAENADKLDAEAKTLMEQHRYAEACARFAASDRLKPGTGVIMRLGLCYERIGKTASAWSTFRTAAARARLAGDTTLAELATKRADVLEPRVPAVRVKLPTDVDAETIDVQCDGVPIDRATLRADAPLHLDPGTHTVQATAPGRRAFRDTFDAAEGARPRTIVIALPLVTTTPLPPPETRDGGESRRTLAFVVGGVGVVGVVVGSVFGLSAMTKWNRAKDECASAPTGCSADALDLEHGVRTDATWSTIGFAVGAVGLVGGAVLLLTAPTQRTSLRVAPMVAAGQAGVSIGGRF